MFNTVDRFPASSLVMSTVGVFQRNLSKKNTILCSKQIEHYEGIRIYYLLRLINMQVQMHLKKCLINLLLAGETFCNNCQGN